MIPKIKIDPTLKPGEWYLKQEKEMTNRDRAFESVPNTIPQDIRLEIVDKVERALDEAENRGFDTSIDKMNEVVSEEKQKSFIEGQKEMRERLALHAIERGDLNCNQIRALPIEGEK